MGAATWQRAGELTRPGRQLPARAITSHRRRPIMAILDMDLLVGISRISHRHTLAGTATSSNRQPRSKTASNQPQLHKPHPHQLLQHPGSLSSEARALPHLQLVKTQERKVQAVYW